jgi:hypothetical protein
LPNSICGIYWWCGRLQASQLFVLLRCSTQVTCALACSLVVAPITRFLGHTRLFRTPMICESIQKPYLFSCSPCTWIKFKFLLNVSQIHWIQFDSYSIQIHVKGNCKKRALWLWCWRNETFEKTYVKKKNTFSFLFTCESTR